MENFWNMLMTNLVLVGILLAVAQICLVIVGYLIIDTVCEYDLEHPIVTFFLLLFFGGLGFFVELFRNTAVDNTRKRIEAQKSAAGQLAQALQHVGRRE